MSRITIPAVQVEFEDGGNTIWVTAPDGSTLMRIKTCGRIRKTTCAGSPSAHCDIMLKKPSAIPTAFTPEATLRALLKEAAKRKLTPQQLANAADLSYAAAHKLLNNQARRPTLETVAAFAAAMGLHFEVLDGYGRSVCRPISPMATDIVCEGNIDFCVPKKPKKLKNPKKCNKS